MGYQQRWKKSSFAERDYTGRLYVPLNTDTAADDFHVGRIQVKIWPTGTGPIYRFRVDFRFCYPGGTTEYIPDNALRELQRAARKAQRRVRRLERIQFLPVWVLIVRMGLGI